KRVPSLVDSRSQAVTPVSAVGRGARWIRRLRMTGFSRRDMLGAAATGGMVAAATGTETFGQGQPPFGPTPAPLAGTELPSFRFQLGAVAPKTGDGGWAKEATVAEFPVSQAIAGVLMSLAPGGLRELHWHANAGNGPMSSKANAGSPPSIRKASRRSSTSMPATSGIFRAA